MASFSLLSLNTFGIPYYRSFKRMKRIAMQLSRIAPTAVCLQEIQRNSYLPLLKDGLTAYAHLAYFPNRYAPMGGLVTASTAKCPITWSEYYPYPNRGKWLSIGMGDWSLQKGVLMVHLDVDGQRVIVMNTHLQANYLSKWQPTNLQTRIQISQVMTLSELVKSQPEDAWVFVCGDFNFHRQTLAYQYLMSLSGLTDPLADDPRPTYNPLPLVSAKWKLPLDYWLYREPKGQKGNISVDILPIEYEERSLPIQRFLTDHKALIINIG